MYDKQKKMQEKQKDVKHLLEEIWYFYPDDTVCEIFSKEAKGGAQLVANQSKEDLEGLTWSKDNGDHSAIMKSDAGEIRSLNKCIAYLKLKGYFPSEAKKLRHNTITIESWDNFACDPDSAKLL